MDKQGSKEQAHAAAYCLACFAALPKRRGTGTCCERCGRTNLKVDLDRYWNLDPKLLMLQSLLRALIILMGVIAIAFVWQLTLQGRTRGGGYGLALIAPLALGAFLWDASALCTHRQTIFRHDIIWPLLPLCLLVVLPLCGMILVVVTQGAWASFLEMTKFTFLFASVGCVLWLGARMLVQTLAQKKKAYLASRLERSLV